MLNVLLRKKRKKWVNIPRDEAHEIHTYPTNDEKDHHFEDCDCVPVTEPVEREDGSIFWLIIHNAWDGRK